MDVWCHKDVNPRLQMPHPSFKDTYVEFCVVAGDVSISMSLPCRHRPIMEDKDTLIWAKIAIFEPRILYETAKIRTTTTVEGIALQNENVSTLDLCKNSRFYKLNISFSTNSMSK